MANRCRLAVVSFKRLMGVLWLKPVAIELGGIEQAVGIIEIERPKVSDPAHGKRGLQPEGDGQVRCSPG